VLEGSYPALVTPLRDPATLADDEVTRLVQRAVTDGAEGVLVAGSTGEGTLLEPEQRVALTRLAHAVLDGGAGQLLACASGPTLALLHDDVERLAAAGADVVLVLAPAIQPLRPEELVDLHVDVAERAAVPTLVYHIPQFTNSPLTPDAVRELARHERIVGMKDSSGNSDRLARFVAVSRDAEAAGEPFAVLTGHAPSLQQALEDGAAGSITAIANVRQRQVVALHDAVAGGDRSEAARLQAALTRVSDGIGAAGASTPAVLKAALQLDGVLAERWCRPPLRSVGPPALDRVRTALLP
jgi:dihydrodipicolinate synthase/N-acetylneuraminate lyase